MLKLTNVKKYYGAQLILDIPHLELSARMNWLKGGNGTGKSTFMKMVAGIIPFEGSIEILSVDLKAKPIEYRRLINYVEAEPLYPPFLTGQDLIHFFRTTRKASKEEVDKLVLELGIGSFIGNPIHTYSSGMVKKLSLALAFTGKPAFILLDEPLVTIDQETVPLLYQLINDYFNRGTNFILTSHQSVDLDRLPPSKELILNDHKICVP